MQFCSLGWLVSPLLEQTSVVSLTGLSTCMKYKLPASMKHVHNM